MILRSLLIATLLAVGPTFAFAAEMAVVSPAQDALLRKGTDAYRRKDFVAAIAAYDEALAMGPLNIALLNKGRSQQRLGNCAGAAETYGKVLDAPAVANPGPDTVRGALTRYREQLAENCPGRLIVTCDPPDARLELVDPQAGLLDANAAGEALPAITCVAPTELPSGSYAVVARAFDQVRRRAVTITGVQTTTLHISISAAREEVVVQSIDPWLVAGWTTVGIAAGALGYGIYSSYDATVTNDRLDRLGRQETVERAELESTITAAEDAVLGQWVGYSLAAVALAGGVWMLMPEDEEPTEGDGPSLLPLAAPGGAGAHLFMRW